MPPEVVAVAEQRAVYAQVRELVSIAPKLAFEKTALLRDPLLRSRLRKAAYLALAARAPEDAAKLLPSVAGEKWLGAVHFAAALDVAWHTVRAQPELSKRLLVESAARWPDTALRARAQYIDLPYGREIFDAATEPLTFERRASQLLLAPPAGLSGAEKLTLAAMARTDLEIDRAVALARGVDLKDPSLLGMPPGMLRAALAQLPDPNVPDALAARAIEGIDAAEDPVQEAARAATFLRKPLPGLSSSYLGQLLRAHIAERGDHFDTAALFVDGVNTQRYVFHDDVDGAESFASFLAAYADWRVERNDNSVKISSPRNGARRIEIFANVPGRALTMKTPPQVIVHRGHDHHIEATLPLLDSGARLIYLGSCRGMQNVEDVVMRSPNAAVIATRAIGVTAVNDAFLKALNVKLLSGEPLRWDAVWNSMRPKLGEHFAGYVPPHRNHAAVFFEAWLRHALAAR
ncbi:MAG: hypothetical protein FJW32_02650 [Acidobacteria bacterium]|nr:hypothetical protein [Acidobacteriota bacterium]